MLNSYEAGKNGYWLDSSHCFPVIFSTAGHVQLELFKIIALRK